MIVQTARKVSRYEQILLRLSDLTYSTSDQLRIINNLGSNRNARKTLYEMEQGGYIKSVFYKKKIYYASNKGSDFIGKGNTRLNRNEINHVLMRNNLYIKLNMPKSWKKEAPIIINGEVVLVSDARFKSQGQHHFVEVDNKQSMRTNYEKIKKYKEVFKMIYRQHKYHPTLIWYTLSQTRKDKLGQSCKNAGIKYKIY